ncbi:MAG: hotdog fold thioesterase [Candidatus Omnitrophota bacterium]|jgi:acyl-CoA thioesterase
MIKNISSKDHFAKYLGVEVLEVKENYAKVALKIQKYFLNSIETTHGGVLFSLADYAFALAANTSDEIGVGINANIQYTKPSFEGEIIFAEAKLLSRSKRVGTFIVTIVNSKQEVLAHFSAMAYFKTPK